MPAASQAIIVVDLAFGDCGKGTIVDYLARTTGAHAVVRFNGGPQAGHNVVLPDGRHHTFSQFGSGSFVSGVKTFLSRLMLIEPYALLNEARHLQELGITDTWDRLQIDGRCLVITPAHEAANRLREHARGAFAHGTCGRGVGEAMQDSLQHPEMIIRADELADRSTIRRKLIAVTQFKRDQLRQEIGDTRHRDWVVFKDTSWIETATDIYTAVAARARIVNIDEAALLLRGSGTILFEGAQGILLDENAGFHPHTTWSNTTAANAESLLGESGSTALRRRIGVLRSYFTRHGHGPMPTENASLRKAVPEPHNDDAGQQGRFRVGHFDCVLARYAAKVAGVDELAITHLDRLEALPPILCTGYRCLAPEACRFFEGTPECWTEVRALPAADFQGREELTRCLAKCSPVLSELPSKAAPEFIQRIEAELAMQVTLRSFGPTWESKSDG